MSALATVMLVAGREIGERLRSRAMWIVTILTAMLLAGLIVVPALIVRGSGPTTVGLTGP